MRGGRPVATLPRSILFRPYHFRLPIISAWIIGSFMGHFGSLSDDWWARESLERPGCRMYQYDSTQVLEHWGGKKKVVFFLQKFLISFFFLYFLRFWQVIFRFSLFGWVNLYFLPISCSAPIPFGIESLNLRLTFVAASASQFLFTLLRLPPISLSRNIASFFLAFWRRNKVSIS